MINKVVEILYFYVKYLHSEIMLTKVQFLKV
jgi:hypothetical protein